VGLHIVQEAEKAGSKNHQLVSKLLKKGAILLKTEDFNLVKQERDRLVKIMRAKGITTKIFSLIIYKLTKKTLLKQRDEYIAQRIDQALKEGETGILFIGAYHHVRSKLPSDIQIKVIRETKKIREYQLLMPFYHKNKKRIEELSQYLISRID
jgi:hypothetical protein